MSLPSFDSVAAPVFVLKQHEDGRVVYAGANHAIARQFGFNPDDVIGKTALEIWSGRQARHIHNAQLDCFSSGQPTEYSMVVTVGGDRRLAEISLIPELLESGAVSFVTGTVTDRTEMAALREELTHARLIQDEMATFLSMAARDMQTPLTIVRNLTAGLRNGFQDLGDGKLQSIDVLEQLATSSMTLIVDMMREVPQERAVFQRTTVDLQRLVNDALILTDPCDEHELSSGDALLQINETAISLYLRELLAGLFKAAGDKRLSLRVEAEDVGDGWAYINLSGTSLDQLTEDETVFASARRLGEAQGGLFRLPRRDASPEQSISLSLPARVVAHRRRKNTA
ncbi:MAG: PAS domain-containing protein [Pseudomonadota bacterium]